MPDSKLSERIAAIAATAEDGGFECHCAEVGRNPAEITRTRGWERSCSAPRVRRRPRNREQLREARRMDMTRYRSYAVDGDSDRVAEQIQALFDAGLDWLVFNLHDVEDVAAVGELLITRFGSR